MTVLQHLIVSLVPHGCAEEYLHSMKKLGVSGSTIIHSRFTDLLSQLDNILSFHVDAEKEMVITLAGRSIAEKICHQLTLIDFEDQVQKPKALSLPVIKSNGIRAESVL